MPQMDFSVIFNIVTALGIIVTFIIAVRKSPHETGNLDATTAQIYQKMARDAAEQQIKDSEEIRGLKLKVDWLERQVRLLKARLAREKTVPVSLQKRVNFLDKKVNALEKQLIEAGIVPVKFEEDSL